GAARYTANRAGDGAPTRKHAKVRQIRVRNMNDQNEMSTDKERDDETMARLLRLAGNRAEIPADIEARVYDRVAEEWRKSTKEPDSSRVYTNVRREWQKTPHAARRSRWLAPMALAASVVLALAVVLRPDPTPTAQPLLAGSIVKVVGTAVSNLPALGTEILVGERLATGPGEGISLRLASNESLRLGENTTVEFDSASQLELLGGRLYADTGDFVYRDKGLQIDTGLGVVRDIGTRFAVVYDKTGLGVAVRDGRVDVQNAGNVVVAVAGERVELTQDRAAVVTPIAANDAYWDWASALAPTFDIENRSLLDFLRYASRETGLELVFADEDLRVQAMRTDLHGSVSDFKPIEAIASVLATTSFRYEIRPDSIYIER
ncbi:MAG TPA: FecR domain-containing protein, partial [Woeseiaceae bacterium]|nr:FecR domain-containing protein [Woeseiaceae bacterium]